MKKILVGVLVLLILAGGAVFASELTGEDVLRLMDERIRVEHKYMEERMTLETKSGTRRVREVAVWNKKSAEGNLMLLKFTDPADIAGTGFLLEEDEMWLYLPALDKVRRIAGSARQGNFMGSDLSYEDMEALGSKGFGKDYQAELVGLTEIDGMQAYHLKLRPVSTSTSYSMLEIWVSKEFFLPVQVYYYGPDGDRIKELRTYQHQQVDGRWIAGRMEMKNLVRDSMTILEIILVDFTREINDGIFTSRFLQRGN